MNNLPAVDHMIALHKDSILTWKAQGLRYQRQDFYRLVEENHAFNYQLWLAEDRARREDKGADFVYQAKREIDACNQQRNNRMEAMDAWLFEALQAPHFTDCPVHSETPGMIIDRLSILALKSYHMGLQTTREDADAAHKAACQQKWEIIQQQWTQLADCLGILLTDIQAKRRTFRLYRQFKMYNDPQLNPELYGK